MEKVPYLGREVLRWQVGSSTFLALPEMGARLMHWHLTLGDGSQRDLIYWPEVDSLKDFHRIRGGNPILFPFNARCYDQNEIGFWRDPQGQRRPMVMHGYARQGLFKLTRCDARGFAAQFIPDEEAKAAYPYEYEFTVTYRFEPLGLACELSLKNLDTVPLPWSAGHHFYFAVPWLEGMKRDDYRIRIPAARTYRQSGTTGLLEPGPQFAATESLANPALVDTLHTQLQSNAVTFGPAQGPGEVTVILGTQKVPPADATFVTWTQDEKSPYYCVEPWMGPPNAPGHKVGLHWVPPGQTQTFVVEVLAKEHGALSLFAMHAFATFTSTPLALFNVGGTEIVVILLLVLLLFGGEKMPELARGIGKALREFKKVSAGVEEELRRAMDEPPPKPKAYPPVQGATPYSVPPPPRAIAPSSTNADGVPPLPSDLGANAALPPVAGTAVPPPTEPTGTTPNPPPTTPTPPPVA